MAEDNKQADVILISEKQISAGVDVVRWALLSDAPWDDVPQLVRDILSAVLSDQPQFIEVASHVEI